MGLSVNTLPHQLLSGLEYTEAEYWSKYYKNKTRLKSYHRTIAGSFAGAVPELDILAFNRVIGLGIKQKINTADIRAIISFFREAGSGRFFIQISPFLTQPDLPELLKNQGFRHYNNWVKLLRPVDKPVAKTNSTLNIQRVPQEKATTYADILYRSFNWEDERIVDWIAASVGMPNYSHYLVKDGRDYIAAGALFINKELKLGSMAFAGTLPEKRGKGAQSQLLKWRLLEAEKMGCDYVFSETAEDKPDNPVTSFRNMRKFGFEIAYLRQNWILEL